ncbi:MAG: TIGR00725 family protein [Candidatus Nitrosocaldaceae archaeon]|nr:MAG: TIGR00725 family protein [Candidatus Nitrosocaldaceae archaeon]
MKMLQILVIGYNSDACTEKAYAIAYETGKLIAESNAVLITGGLGGVMEAASKGAYDANGLTIGIIPYDDASKANPYCKIVISTGLGYARNYINAYSADGVIIIGGGVGTLIEAGVAYMKKKPIIAIRGSGGIADAYTDKYLDDRNFVKIEGVDTPKEAVDLIIKKNKGITY